MFQLIIPGYKSEAVEKREALFKEAIERGFVLRFESIVNGIVKHVDSWEPDETHGDLRACWQSAGIVDYVCAHTPYYNVTCITQEDALKEREGTLKDGGE